MYVAEKKVMETQLEIQQAKLEDVLYDNEVIKNNNLNMGKKKKQKAKSSQIN